MPILAEMTVLRTLGSPLALRRASLCKEMTAARVCSSIATHLYVILASHLFYLSHFSYTFHTFHRSSAHLRSVPSSRSFEVITRIVTNGYVREGHEWALPGWLKVWVFALPSPQ